MECTVPRGRKKNSCHPHHARSKVTTSSPLTTTMIGVVWDFPVVFYVEIFWHEKILALVGGFKHFLFSPLFREDEPILTRRSYFSDGLVQPPTSSQDQDSFQLFLFYYRIDVPAKWALSPVRAVGFLIAPLTGIRTSYNPVTHWFSAISRCPISLHLQLIFLENIEIRTIF